MKTAAAQEVNVDQLEQCVGYIVELEEQVINSYDNKMFHPIYKVKDAAPIGISSSEPDLMYTIQLVSTRSDMKVIRDLVELMSSVFRVEYWNTMSKYFDHTQGIGIYSYLNYLQTTDYYNTGSAGFTVYESRKFHLSVQIRSYNQKSAERLKWFYDSVGYKQATSALSQDSLSAIMISYLGRSSSSSKIKNADDEDWKIQYVSREIVSVCYCLSLWSNQNIKTELGTIMHN